MEKIYHYTSIDNLALILKNKTLRFNCLKNVDDMEEGQSYDYGDVSKFLFASSWTSDKNENIALWNMYTPKMVGVRIGLPRNILDLELDRYGLIRNGTFYGDNSKNEILLTTHFGPLPEKVIYVDNNNFNKNLIRNTYYNATSTIPVVQLQQLGLIKDNKWKFQEEVRFVLQASLPRKNNPSGSTTYFAGDVLAGLLRNEDFDLSHIDIPLKQNIFSKLEIMLGPRCHDNCSKKIIVESLVHTLLPRRKITIEKSSLRIR